MSRGNDAIPTWSGFNYQGKMMLFYVLKLINQINQNNDTRAYSVELERTEDFCIIRDLEYVSFHQIKAWLSTTKWSSYTKAMDKLLQHRNDASSPTAKCFLMVAKEIEDWNDTTNTYNLSIELYKHDSRIIGVCDVRNLIIQEIEEYLRQKGHPMQQAEVVYGELCLYLDDQIATMHKQGVRQRKYAIPFSCFIDVIEEAVNKAYVREEYYLKERVYNYIMESMERAMESLCQDACGNSLLNCNKECAAKTAYEKVMEISDYTSFCKLLNPSKIDGWDDSLTLVANFPVEKLQNEIYELLYQSKTPEKVSGDGRGIYLQSKFSNAKSGQIIPTLLDLSRGYKRNGTLQRIFQNIVNNTDIGDILEGNSITAIPGGYNGALSQAKIASGWRDSNPEKKVGHYYRDIEILSSKDLLHEFERNGGNHD